MGSQVAAEQPSMVSKLRGGVAFLPSSRRHIFAVWDTAWIMPSSRTQLWLRKLG
jgi:hypothetical protein